MRFAVLLLLIACTPQADSGYLGEPLLSVRGQVVSSGDLPSLEAAMLWQRGDPPSSSDQELATRAPVQAGFPATFTVRLYQPPPAAAQRTLGPGEPVWARANAAAVPAGTPDAVVAVLGGAAAANPGATQYGIDPDHWVLWLARDVAAGSLTEWWMGGALTAGFHLVDVAVVNPACVTADQLAACIAELHRRGVADDAAAKAFCLAPYRLSPAAAGEELRLQLGAVGLSPGGGTCP